MNQEHSVDYFYGVGIYMCISYNSINRKLSISEMAQIHNITRQTLIYYDKIGLFKPDITESNGYRFYSTLQIPLLSEICFLKSIGMPLEDIRKNNEYNNSQTTIQLLESQESKLKDKIAKLNNQLEMIEKRVSIYKNAHDFDTDDYKPTIRQYPERKVFFYEWENQDLSRHGLHYALMRCWNLSEKYGLLPTNRYGSLFFYKNVKNGDPLKKAGTCCILESDAPFAGGEKHIDNIYSLRAGDYACIYKFGMPYDTSGMEKLLQWIEENGYEVDGRVYDECLMDGSFYEDSDLEDDFCELQIPIRKKQN